MSNFLLGGGAASSSESSSESVKFFLAERCFPFFLLPLLDPPCLCEHDKLVVPPVPKTVPHPLIVSLVPSDKIVDGESREINALLDRCDNLQVPGRGRAQEPPENRGLREVFSKRTNPIDESNYPRSERIHGLIIAHDQSLIVP